MEAFFLPTPDGQRLFALWRGARTAPRAWLICPPLAEEDKSARRTLSELAKWLQARGEASLLFSFRGMGDSSGDYAEATFAGWRTDLRAACAALRQMAPTASFGLIGVRLGASLALLEDDLASEGVETLVLIEPLLIGRQFLSQQAARKKMRAQLTSSEGSATSDATPPKAETAPTPGASAVLSEAAEDFDGWPLAPTLRADFQALDLRQDIAYAGTSHVLGVGPRSEVAPPLLALAQALGGEAQAVVMPAFWNLLDYSEPKPLIEALERALGTPMSGELSP